MRYSRQPGLSEGHDEVHVLGEVVGLLGPLPLAVPSLLLLLPEVAAQTGTQILPPLLAVPH